MVVAVLQERRVFLEQAAPAEWVARPVIFGLAMENQETREPSELEQILVERALPERVGKSK